MARQGCVQHFQTQQLFDVNASHLILVLPIPQAASAELLNTGSSDYTLAEDRERRAPQEAVPDIAELARALKALQLERDLYNEQHKLEKVAAEASAAAAYAKVAQLQVEVAALGAHLKQADQANCDHTKVNLCILLASDRLECPITFACFSLFINQAVKLTLTYTDYHPPVLHQY